MNRGNVTPRVLMLDSERTWRGGENQLFLLVRGLHESQAAHVTLAAPPGAAIATRVAALGVPCRTLPMHSDLDLLAALRLRRLLGAEPFDLVHCHASHAHGVAFLALGPRRRRPLLVVSRRVDFPFARRGPSALKYRYGADLYIAISTGVREVLLGGGVAPERLALVRSGIDLSRHRDQRDTMALRRELGITDGTQVVGSVAALAPHKALEDFIAAAGPVAAALPATQFFIVGEGAERPRLEALIRAAGLANRVILTGFRDDALAILSLFDCFVLSSALEGLCTSIMDAQALGVPVVATRTGGVPDLVQDGETGLLVPPRQPAALADAILRLLRDAGLRTRLAAAARARAETYGYEHMVRGTLEAYQRLLGDLTLRKR